jgi:hypothetical protein
MVYWSRDQLDPFSVKILEWFGFPWWVYATTVIFRGFTAFTVSATDHSEINEWKIYIRLQNNPTCLKLLGEWHLVESAILVIPRVRLVFHQAGVVSETCDFFGWRPAANDDSPLRMLCLPGPRHAIFLFLITFYLSNIYGIFHFA